jgi:hypothetical protein
METLAVIAYHQSVTRAEVEEIRGVVMSNARSADGNRLDQAAWAPQGAGPPDQGVDGRDEPGHDLAGFWSH